MTDTLRKELEQLLNAHSAENQSNTPDFILAQYLSDCLIAFDKAVKRRAEWYGRMDSPGSVDDKAVSPFKLKE